MRLKLINDIFFPFNVFKQFLDLFVIKGYLKVNSLFVFLTVSHKFKGFGLFGSEIGDLFAHLKDL